MTANDGHSAPVSAAAVSPDGRVYASAGYDRTILLWDAERGHVLRRIEGHTGLVNGLDWSPDGTLLASASSDRSARLWHALTGSEVTRLTGHGDDVNSVRWSPDGSRLATASFDGTVRVWTRAGACALVAGHHRSDVNGVAWFPDGRRLAAASDDRTVSVFDAEDGRLRRLLQGHGDWVDQVAVHPAGLILASAGLDGSVGVWNVHSGARLADLDASTCVVKDVAWSRDGHHLAATSYDGCVRVYANGSFRLCREYRGEGLWNRTLASSPRGWLTGSFGGGPVELGEQGVRRFGRSTTGGLNQFAVAPDGRRAVACSDDGRLYEIDLAARRVTGVLGEHGAAALCAAWSPDGARVVSGSWDRSVRVWDVAERRLRAHWAGRGDPINAVAFDATGEGVWIGTFNGELVWWDPQADRAVAVASHHGSIKALARSGATLVSVGRDGEVMSVPAERAARSAGAAHTAASTAFTTGGVILNGVALPADGERIATVSRRNGIELWSRDGARLGSFGQHPCSAKSVAFSADGRRVAASYYDGRVALWEPASGLARVEHVSDASLSCVAFLGDELLVSAWDSAGSLHFIDPVRDRCERLEVAA